MLCGYDQPLAGVDRCRIGCKSRERQGYAQQQRRKRAQLKRRASMTARHQAMRAMNEARDLLANMATILARPRASWEMVELINSSLDERLADV